MDSLLPHMFSSDMMQFANPSNHLMMVHTASSNELTNISPLPSTTAMIPYLSIDSSLLTSISNNLNLLKHTPPLISHLIQPHHHPPLLHPPLDLLALGDMSIFHNTSLVTCPETLGGEWCSEHLLTKPFSDFCTHP